MAAFLVDHARAVILGFLLLTGAAAVFVPRFEIEASAETLLTRDNRLFLQARQDDARFAPEEFLLVGYRPRDGDLFSAGSLASLQALAGELGTLERAEKVNYILNVPLLSAMDELDPALDPLEWTWEKRRFSAEEMRRILEDHPIYTGLLVDPELTATAIQVVFREDPALASLEREIIALEGRLVEGSLSEAEQTELESLEARAEPLREALREQREREVEEVYRIIAPYEDRAELYPGGVHVLGIHLIDMIRHDLVVFGSAIAVAVCLLLLLLFRDFRWVLISLACCAVSVLVTMGLFGLLKLKTTVISANFIALQLILTLALAIHLIVQYRVLAARGEASHRELLVGTLREKALPSFYAAVTTSVGFGSLLFSGLQPVISFGWMMVVAMAVTTAVSLLLFPALAALWTRPLPHAGQALAARLVGLFRFSLRVPRSVMLGALLLIALSLAGLPRLNVENSFIDYFRDSTRVSRELRFIDRELGGTTPLDIFYRVPESAQDELVAPAEVIETLQKIQYSLESSRAVGSAMSVVNFTELARELNGGKPLTEYELNSLWALLGEGIREELLGAYFDPRTREFRISLRLVDSTPGLDRGAFLDAVEEIRRGLGIAEENFRVGNLFVLYQDILERLYRSQILTLGLVYLALGLVLLAVFRSPRVALVALLPNLIPPLFILGLMGWAGIPLDLMTITIAAIAMGIAVDDTIHFTHHYLKDLKRAPGEAAARSYSNVGHAMLYTSLVIAFGFSILMLSDFVPSVLFGMLTAAAMGIALLADLTLLPVLLERFVKERWHGT